MPFAHLGHWYVGLPVYLSPVVAVFLLLKVSEWRDKRRKAREASDAAANRPPEPQPAPRD